MTAEPIAQAKIRIRPDFTGFKQETDAEVTQATDRASGKVRIGADTGEASVKLDALKARLAEMRDRVNTAKVALDGDDKAQQRLSSLELQLRRVGLTTARPKVNLEGVERANIQLDALEAKMALVGRGGAGGGGGRVGTGGGFLSRLPNPSGRLLALGGLLPLAGPLAALGVGGAASLLTPTVAGGIGLGAFGAGAKASITTVSQDVAKLTKLTQQYNAATTDKQRAAVLAKEHTLWQSLDPAQRRAVKNVETLEGSWKHYQKALEPQTFHVLADASKLANTGLGYLLPVAKATGDEVDHLAKRAEAAFKAPFWHEFFGSFLTTEAPRAVDTLGTVLGRVGSGLAHLAEDFAPLGHDLENAVSRWSGTFEAWTQGAGPGKFVAWVEANGPQAAHTLGALASGIGGLARGLSPIGQIELKALEPVLNFIGTLGKEHPAVITALGGALLTIGVGLKGIAAVRGLSGIANIIRGIGGSKVGGGGVLGKVEGGLGTRVFVTNWPPGFGGRGPSTTGPGGVGIPGKNAPGETLPGETPPPRRGIRLPSGIGETATSIIASVLAGGTIASQLSHSGPGPVNKVAAILSGGAVFGAQGGELRGSNNVLPYDPSAHVLSPEQASKIPAGKVAGLMFVPTAGDEQKLAAYNAQQKTLNQLLVVNPGLAKNAAAANKLLGDAVAGVTQQIQTTGIAGYSSMQQLGKDLMAGLLSGLQQGEKITVPQANATVASIIKHMRYDQSAANAHSPSRNTIPIGRDLADGILVGWDNAAATWIGKMPQAFQDVISKMQQRVQTDAQKLQSDIASRLSYRQSLQSQLAAPLSSLTISSGGQGPQGILGALGDEASGLKALLGYERRLQRRHLDPRLLQQVIEAGPIQGAMLAQQLLSGRGTIHQANILERQIQGTARRTATGVANALYDPTIRRDEQHLARALSALEHMLAHGLKFDAAQQRVFAEEIARAIVRALPGVNVREIDRLLGVRVTNKR